VRIVHHKTAEVVWHQLGDDAGPFYGPLEQRIQALPRLGVPMILKAAGAGRHAGPPKPFDQRHAAAIVRRARRAAGLPEHVTLDACRHGGLTELGDAGATESQEMAMSGHQTPRTKRRYVKVTDAQRLAAARKRRAWVSDGRRPGVETPSLRGVEMIGHGSAKPLISLVGATGFEPATPCSQSRGH
jgi:hypothetical protein